MAAVAALAEMQVCVHLLLASRALLMLGACRRAYAACTHPLAALCLLMICTLQAKSKE